MSYASFLVERSVVDNESEKYASAVALLQELSGMDAS